MTKGDRAMVAIDLGTTVLKVAAFDARTGAPLAQASERLPVREGRDGEREQSVGAVLRAVREACREVVTALGGRTVEAVGLAAQGGSTIIADRERGKPLTPMILWTDMRARSLTAEVLRRKPVGFWRRRTLRDAPGQGYARFLWLRQRRPELFGEANIHAGAGGFLCHRLTGVWRQDPCHALQIGGYDAARERLDARMLDIVGVPLSFVAPLRKGHEVHPLSRSGARLTGLPAGVPVSGPYIDQEAGYLSAAAARPRPLQMSLGTAWVGNFVLPRDARWRSATQLVLPSLVDDGRHVCQPLGTGNIAWDWALGDLVDADHGRALAKAMQVFRRRLLPPRGLLALPFVNSPNPLVKGALGGGGFFGVSASTTSADLLRATAFGLCAEMARVFSGVLERGHIECVTLGGGAAKGAFFRKLLAGLLHPLPVFQVLDNDLAGPRGALSAFGGKAASVRLRRVKAPMRQLDEIRRMSDDYERLLEAAPGGARRPIEFLDD